VSEKDIEINETFVNVLQKWKISGSMTNKDREQMAVQLLLLEELRKVSEYLEKGIKN